MKNFDRRNRDGADRGNRGFVKRDFGVGNRGFAGRDQGRPPMHQAICDQCGKNCEVPFRPTGDRPVFCSACFEQKKGFAPVRSSGNKFSRPNFEEKTTYRNDQFEILNDKLDKILQALKQVLTLMTNPASEIEQDKSDSESPKKEKKNKIAKKVNAKKKK